MTTPSVLKRLHLFFFREDAVYDKYADEHQARTLPGKPLYLFLHLLPGILAAVIINVPAVYLPFRNVFGVSDRTFQYALLIIVTFGWHITLPFIILTVKDKLSFRESLAFIGFDRFDARGLFVVLPVIMIIYTLISIPWFRWVASPLKAWLASIPLFAMPDYSIFAGDLYDFPAVMLLFLLIGNFVGEEVYYRGYLMKKTAYLGRYNWWISSALFAIYHFWQVEQTWSLLLPAFIFGAVMVIRKDLYVVIILHLLLNVWWIDFMFDTFEL